MNKSENGIILSLILGVFLFNYGNIGKYRFVLGVLKLFLGINFFFLLCNF